MILVYLLKETPLELRAGLITYSCMLDGPSIQNLGPWVIQALPTITNLLLNNPNGHVKEEAAIALERTAEIIPQVYFHENTLSTVIVGLTTSIGGHPRVITFKWLIVILLDLFTYNQVMALSRRRCF